MTKTTLYSMFVFSILMFLNSPALATPITQASPHAHLNNQQNNPFGTSDGVFFNVSVNRVDPDGLSGTTATASNSGTTVSLVNTRPDLFGYSITYANALSNSQLDSWEINLSNGGDQATRITPNRENAQVMGLAQNLAISGSALSPTVSWMLPSSGPTVTRMRYEVWNMDTQTVISGIAPVKLGAAEVSATLSDLSVGTNYAVRIIPEQHDNAGAISRSSNWMTWQATTGDVQGTFLSLTTGPPVGVSQHVDTQSGPFNIEFDYRFTTTSGELSVFLDDMQIGTLIEAPSAVEIDFSHALFNVDNPLFFNRLNIPLSINFDGITGSNILIDNFSLPGLANGGFDQGLNSWTQQGLGTAEVNPVPEPASMLLFGAGLVGLAGLRFRRKK